MKKLDYLKLAINAGLPNNLAWIVSAFCLTKEAPTAYKENPYAYRLVASLQQYQCVLPNGELEVIEDSSTQEPLFAFKEQVQIDPEWASNVKEPCQCTIGNLIFQAVAIGPAFGKKYPFTAGKIALDAHEKYIASRLADTPKPGEPRDDAKIYVDEYLHFRDSLVFLEQLAAITSWSATRKGITAPEGIDQYRMQLLSEYEDRLDDPAAFAEYEGKLKAFDDAWLKDDPAYGSFIKGKVKDISRKKMFLAIGIPDRLDLKDPIVPITRTLEDGQPTDPAEYTALLNGARFGSFSRGSETINGGVVSKSLIRVGSNFVIDMEDCGATFGLRKIYTKETISMLVGRSVIESTGSVKVENSEQANNYLGRPVLLRSPAFCKAGPGDRLCKTCAGAALSQYEKGLIIPLTEVSQLILNQSLKAMHGKVLSVATVDLASVLS